MEICQHNAQSRIPINLSREPNNALCKHYWNFLCTIFIYIYEASSLPGKFRSTCNVPHCQSLPIASLNTNSIFGP